MGPSLYVRVEEREPVKTEADYVLEVKKPKHNREGKIIKRLELSKRSSKHSVWLTLYEYKARDNCLVFASECPID